MYIFFLLVCFFSFTYLEFFSCIYVFYVTGCGGLGGTFDGAGTNGNDACNGGCVGTVSGSGKGASTSAGGAGGTGAGNGAAGQAYAGGVGYCDSSYPGGGGGGYKEPFFSTLSTHAHTLQYIYIYIYRYITNSVFA